MGVVDHEDGGVALLFPPGTNPYSVRLIVRSGLVAMPARTGIGATRRMLRAERELAAAPGATRHPVAWLLAYLAVHPSRQGRGLARRPLDRGLSRAGGSGHAVTLETNRQSNVDIYRRFWFEVEATCLTDSLPQWSMVREPLADS